MRAPGGVLIVAVVLVAGAVFALLSRDATPPPIATGQAAPGFTLDALSGDRPVRLEDLRGRVVLVNFWATWCKPCEDEMPSMERLHRKLEGQPFDLLAVSVDDDAAAVAAFVEKLGLTMPILLDPSKKVASSYQAYRFPESVLIDAEGRVAGRFVGPREWDSDTYVGSIQALLPKAGGGAG